MSEQHLLDQGMRIDDGIYILGISCWDCAHGYETESITQGKICKCYFGRNRYLNTHDIDAVIAERCRLFHVRT